MALDFKSAEDVAQEYRDELKSILPNENVDQQDSDWWIRGAVIGGVISGVYADQRLISNDAFPQRARHEALDKFLEMYFDDTFLPATESQGNVAVTGTIGSTIPAGTQLTYTPNGNAYQVTETTVLAATAESIPVMSVATGQNQNLNAGASLLFPSAPAGVNANAVVDDGGLSDARDSESDDEARERILLRIRSPLGVGRESDYIQYAKDASPSVTGASVVRYPYGLGTVAVYVTSGTTDIDTAIDNGDTISIIPSDALIDTVQAFLEENKPVTDCVTVLKPSELPVDVTVSCRFSQGDKDTILSGQTLTQGELVEREIRRAIYKTPVGGRKFDGIGYVVKSEIEETIDIALSTDPVTVGSIPILKDRYVSDLAATGVNLMILQNEAPTPGTITIQEF